MNQHRLLERESNKLGEDDCSQRGYRAASGGPHREQQTLELGDAEVEHHLGQIRHAELDQRLDLASEAVDREPSDDELVGVHIECTIHTCRGETHCLVCNAKAETREDAQDLDLALVLLDQLVQFELLLLGTNHGLGHESCSTRLAFGETVSPPC